MKKSVKKSCHNPPPSKCGRCTRERAKDWLVGGDECVVYLCLCWRCVPLRAHSTPASTVACSRRLGCCPCVLPSMAMCARGGRNQSIASRGGLASGWVCAGRVVDTPITIVFWRENPFCRPLDNIYTASTCSPAST